MKKFLQERNIPCLDWSAQFPDLNPIENVWDNVKHQLRNEKITNLYGNGVKLKRRGNVWIMRVIEGMPKRLRAVRAQ